MRYNVNKITEQINVGILKAIVDASNETIWATRKAMARELLTSDEGLMHRSGRPIEPEA